MNQQELYYQYLERQRRQSIYKQYYNYLKYQKIQEIRQFIQAGGDIKESSLYDDYLKLVDESDGKYFIFDDNMGDNQNLTKEEEYYGT